MTTTTTSTTPSPFIIIDNNDGTCEVIGWNESIGGSASEKSSLIIPTLIEGLTPTSIGASAFLNDTNPPYLSWENLQEVVFSNSVSSVGESAFYNCPVQKAYFLGNAPTSFGENVFQVSTLIVYDVRNEGWVNPPIINYPLSSELIPSNSYQWVYEYHPISKTEIEGYDYYTWNEGLCSLKVGRYNYLWNNYGTFARYFADINDPYSYENYGFAVNQSSSLNKHGFERLLIFENVTHDGSTYNLNEPYSLTRFNFNSQPGPVQGFPFKTDKWDYTNFDGDARYSGAYTDFIIDGQRLYQYMSQNPELPPPNVLHTIKLECLGYRLVKFEPEDKSGNVVTHGNVLINSSDFTTLTGAPPPSPWQLKILVNDNDTFGFYVGNALGMSVDWDDGNPSQIIPNGNQSPSILYETGGEKNLIIYGGSCDRILFNNNPSKLIEVINPIPNFSITNFNNTFENCINLTNIPEGLFDNNIGISNLNETFSNCNKLNNIPNGLFNVTSNVNVFSGTFRNCTTLTSIPSGLFDNNISVILFNQTFMGCTNLNSLPNRLFNNNINVNAFNDLFSGCSNLSSIPEDLFDNNYKVKFFVGTFSGCTSLSGIPNNLFKNNVDVENFGGAFQNCERLNSIPEDLFANNPKARFFFGTFQNCINLSSIPSGLFDNLTFNAPKQFIFTFSNCRSLTDIPSGLFDNIANYVEYFRHTFSNCISLSSIPVGLFDNVRDGIGVRYIDRTFEDCINLNQDARDLTFGKPYLWERAGLPGYSTTIIGTNFASNAHPTFRNCVSTDWGGAGNDCDATTTTSTTPEQTTTTSTSTTSTTSTTTTTSTTPEGTTTTSTSTSTSTTPEGTTTTSTTPEGTTTSTTLESKSTYTFFDLSVKEKTIYLELKSKGYNISPTAIVLNKFKDIRD